jgi:hypothetical protein
MTKSEAEDDRPNDDEFVYVRRGPSDWKIGGIRVSSISDLHMSESTGGVLRATGQSFLFGYISCDDIVEGEIAHSCRHGKGPHRIKVCVVQKDNNPDLYRRPRRTVEPEWKSSKRRKRPAA